MRAIVLSFTFPAPTLILGHVRPVYFYVFVECVCSVPWATAGPLGHWRTVPHLNHPRDGQGKLYPWKQSKPRKKKTDIPFDCVVGWATRQTVALPSRCLLPCHPLSSYIAILSVLSTKIALRPLVLNGYTRAENANALSPAEAPLESKNKFPILFLRSSIPYPGLLIFVDLIVRFFILHGLYLGHTGLLLSYFRVFILLSHAFHS